jgi:hypothetical protein
MAVRVGRSQLATRSVQLEGGKLGRRENCPPQSDSQAGLRDRISEDLRHSSGRFTVEVHVRAGIQDGVVSVGDHITHRNHSQLIRKDCRGVIW